MLGATLGREPPDMIDTRSEIAGLSLGTFVLPSQPIFEIPVA